MKRKRPPWTAEALLAMFGALKAKRKARRRRKKSR